MLGGISSTIAALGAGERTVWLSAAFAAAVFADDFLLAARAAAALAAAVLAAVERAAAAFADDFEAAARSAAAFAAAAFAAVVLAAVLFAAVFDAAADERAAAAFAAAVVFDFDPAFAAGFAPLAASGAEASSGVFVARERPAEGRFAEGRFTGSFFFAAVASSSTFSAGRSEEEVTVLRYQRLLTITRQRATNPRRPRMPDLSVRCVLGHEMTTGPF